MERRVMSWRGRVVVVVVAERTSGSCVCRQQKKENVMRKEKRKGFMVLGWWGLWMRRGWCSERLI